MSEKKFGKQWFREFKGSRAKRLRVDTGSAGDQDQWWKFWGKTSDAVEKEEEEGSGLLGRMFSRKQEESSCCPTLSRTQRFTGFGLCLVTGVGLIVLSFAVFLPMILLSPSKFALSFTLGSLLFLTSFALLQGPAKYLASMIQLSRLPFTLFYAGTLGLTLYSCLIWKSYILTIMFAVSQLIGLACFSISVIPGGSKGIKLFGGLFIKGVRACCRKETGIPM